MVDTTIEATILIKAVHNFLETTDNVNKRDRDEISIKYNTLENKYKEKIFRANEVMEKNKYTIEQLRCELEDKTRVVEKLEKQVAFEKIEMANYKSENKRDRDEISIKYNTLKKKYKKNIESGNEVTEKNKSTIEQLRCELEDKKRVVENEQLKNDTEMPQNVQETCNNIELEEKIARIEYQNDKYKFITENMVSSVKNLLCLEGLDNKLRNYKVECEKARREYEEADTIFNQL